MSPAPDPHPSTPPSAARVDIGDLPLSIPERHRKQAAVDTLVPEIKRSRPLLRTLVGIALALVIVNGAIWISVHRGNARPTGPAPTAAPHAPVPVVVAPGSSPGR